MQLDAIAIICAVRAHGEHGVIARAMTAEAGLLAGYVRGGRSRQMRPALIPGNSVSAHFRGRGDTQLPGLTVEIQTSRAPLMTEPLAAAAIEWACALTARALPEGQAYPAIFAALNALLDAIGMAPSARGWAMLMVRFELLVLRELGFGLALDRCVVTGSDDDLAYVSPKSASAVSRSAAAGYESQLLPLPAFLIGDNDATLPAVLDGLRLAGHFIARRLFDDVRNDPMVVRERMIARLHRAVA